MRDGLMYSVVWSIIGLLLGFPAGTFFERYRLGKKVQDIAKQGQQQMGEDPTTPTEVGVMVHGTEVDRVLVKPSPVPRAVVIILIVLAAISVGSTIVQNYRQNDLRSDSAVKACYGQVQNRILILEIAQSDTRFGQVLKQVGDPKLTSDQRALILKNLGDFLTARAERARQPAPPLSPAAIEDCKDGNLDSNGIG